MLMSMFYIGGELAQSRLGLPKSLTGVFQGLLLFCLLACDTLIHYRLRLAHAGRGAARRRPDGCHRLLIAATLNAGTVLALAALGLLINERAGIVNLGAEGMMLVRRDRRLRHRRAHRQRLARPSAPASRPARCWRPCSACW